MENTPTDSSTPPQISYSPKPALAFSDTPYSAPKRSTPNRLEQSSRSVGSIKPRQDSTYKVKPDPSRQEKTTPPLSPQPFQDHVAIRALPPTRPVLQNHLEVLPQGAAAYPPPYKEAQNKATQDQVRPGLTTPDQSKIQSSVTLPHIVDSHRASESNKKSQDPVDWNVKRDLESDFHFDFPSLDNLPSSDDIVVDDQKIDLSQSSHEIIAISEREGLDLLMNVDEDTRTKQLKFRAKLTKLKQQREEMFDAYYDRLHTLEETLEQKIESSTHTSNDTESDTDTDTDTPLGTSSVHPVTRPITKLPSSQQMLSQLFPHLDSPSHQNNDHQFADHDKRALSHSVATSDLPTPDEASEGDLNKGDKGNQETKSATQQHVELGGAYINF
jgi:hypothetical protein